MVDLNGLVARAQRSELSLSQLFEAGDQLNNSGHIEAYIELFRTWITFNSEDQFLHLALYNYAAAICRSDLDSAILTLRYALKIKTDYYPIYINLANYLERRGRNDLALKVLQELDSVLVLIRSDTVEIKLTALNQIGRIFQAAGDFEGAELSFERSLAINEHQPLICMQWINLRQKQCKWPLLPDQLSQATKERRIRGLAPLSLAYFVDDPLFQLANAYRYNKEVVRWVLPGVYSNIYTLPQKSPNRLRIGYVSSDFRGHAVGYSMTEVVELHDRSKFEIFAYYCGSVRQTDETQGRIIGGVDHWLDIHDMDDQAVADRIRSDGIHIIVDLNGYTMDARTRVFSMQPAPIIVNWFGYPGTMGSPYHHYIIADEVIIPEDSKRFYSEKVLYLPCYQPNDRKRIVSDRVPSRDEYGIPKDAFVFCSFNGLQKLNLPTFNLWMRILREVPGSVLWLLGESISVNDRLIRLANEWGVNSERLVFARQVPNPVHLARYPLADLFLDSLPYGAHTTAADSMWMGLPLVTIAGGSFPARVCASLMRAAGIGELIAIDQDDYFNKAVSLARDLAMLQEYRKRLLINRGTSILFDTPLLMSHLENLYNDMWEDFMNGRLPQPDLSNLDVCGEIAVSIDRGKIGLINWEAYLEIYKNFSEIGALHLK